MRWNWRPRAAAALVLGCVLAIGCKGLVDIDDPVLEVNPNIQQLTISAPVLVHGAVLVDVRLSPGQPELLPNHRIRLTLETASGDLEEVLVRNNVCTTPAGVQHSCNSFMISTRSGTTVYQLSDRLSEIDGRFRLITTAGDIGSIVILSGDLKAAMTRASQWPGVRYVELNGIVDYSGGGAASTSIAGGAIGLDLGSAVHNDGRVQIQNGNWISATYRQPNGTLLTSTITTE